MLLWAEVSHQVDDVLIAIHRVQYLSVGFLFTGEHKHVTLRDKFLRRAQQLSNVR